MTTHRTTPWLLAAALTFAFALAGAAPAEASKGCWCWIGVEREREADRLRLRGPLPGHGVDKEGKCSTACSARCAVDLQNPDRLCQAAGHPIPANAKIGCFSVVGASDNDNNTWDYDGRPSRFPGCRKTCSCPRGWYDANRDSCVTGACENVKGLPNGNKGGGYFAWNETLFLDIPGKTGCKVGPTGNGGNGSCKWTSWLNRDRPGGVGDFETLPDFVKDRQACAEPKKIECQTTDGRTASSTGQPYICDPKRGGICQNSQMPSGQTCQDYRVRFCC